jgi:signal peptidase II
MAASVGSANFTPRFLGLCAAVLALVADQGSKIALLYGAGFGHMAPGQTIPVLPFFNLVMVWNPGISYGLFPASGVVGTWALEAATLAVIGFLGWWLWNSRDSVVALGCGLIVGGGLGNLIDRVLYGRVADFFHFHGFGYDWYVFNIADLAVTLGAVAFIYDVLKPSESSKNA